MLLVSAFINKRARLLQSLVFFFKTDSKRRNVCSVFIIIIIIIIIKNLRISEGISPNMTQSRVQRWGFEVDKSYKDK